MIACKIGPSGLTVLEKDPKFDNSELDSYLDIPGMVQDNTPDGKHRYFFQQAPELEELDRKDLGIKVLPKDAIIYLSPSHIIGWKKKK